MESNSDYSIDGKYSMHNSIIGVFKENNNRTKSGIVLSKIKDDDNENDNDYDNDEEEDEEISDINPNSFIEDNDDYDFISNITQGINNNYNNSKSNLNEEEYEEESDDYDNYRLIERKENSFDTAIIDKCLYRTKIPEENISTDINIGFTQMVDKYIKKSYDEPYYINNRMLEILMVAEKPSLAKVITKILGGKDYKIHFYESITVYTFKRLFKGKKANFTVASVLGHIYQDAFDDYDEDIEIKDLYNEKIIKTIKKNKDNERIKKLNIPKFLRKIAEGKDILCLWLDCDPEGENICYEVIHNVYPYMNIRDYQQIYRAKFNSLTKKDIRDSFHNLYDYPNKSLSMAVDARSIIDFKVGVCFTKLFSDKILKHIRKYNIPGYVKRVMSYGPCQTPTLWFCVKRFKERKKNIPKSYYQIFIEIEDDKGEVYKLYMNKKFDSKKEVLKRMNKVKYNFYADLISIQQKKKRKPSPGGLKTLSMLKMASLQLGLSPFEASSDAQQLYMNGLISYPRTKSTKYSENFDFESSLKMFKNNIHFTPKINELIENFDKKDVDFAIDDDQGGHEPIIPTLSTTKENISSRLNWDLYKCICMYYFASLSPDLEYINREYVFAIEDYKLKLNLSKIIKEGFLKFLPVNNIKFVNNFPSFQEEKHYKIVNIDYEKNYYTQLNYLTEAELIDEMEKNHIGTDGSTPSHIKNLSSRKYVRINENRRIIPTKLGVVLIDSLNEVVPDIVKPENRARIEEYVKQIEMGEKSFKEAIDSALDFYKGKLSYCIFKIDNIKEEFKKYFDFYD